MAVADESLGYISFLDGSRWQRVCQSNTSGSTHEECLPSHLGGIHSGRRWHGIGELPKRYTSLLTRLKLLFFSRLCKAMTFYWTLSAALTLLQARTLKAPTIRRLMKLPIIKPAPPPPRGTIIEKPPTLRDTLREGREMFMGSIDEAKKKQQAKLDAEAGRVATRVMSSGGSSSSASSSSSLQTQEIVRELPTQRAAQGVVYDAAETTGAGTSGSAASSSSSSSRRGGGNSPVMDAVAQAKANRIAAARARREQQQQQSATGSR